MRFAICHPEKKHKAFNLCRNCYANKLNKTEAGQKYIKMHNSSTGRKAYLNTYYTTEKYRASERARSKLRRSQKLSYFHHKSKNDIQFKLKNIIRDRFAKAVKFRYKKGLAIENLGCSMDFFAQYFESLFKKDMTWHNFGQHGWHIDHVKPLASFDLTDPAQVKQACHYTNLQPLWARDNLSKGAKYVK